MRHTIAALTVRAATCAAYFAFLAWLTWLGGTNDGDEGFDSAALITLFFLGWAASSALIGYWLGTSAFAVPIAAGVGAATVGDVLDKFDNELRTLNWVIQVAVSAVFIALGIWLRNRRRRRHAAN
ncbi:MAG TPA: hypothetical protein VFR49_12790 [Solirubrobacteraceae bacterium]|nr:hypothetical protein [Solirubrobacteraceae bacterium]